MSTTSLVTPITFNGQSKYSGDFQNIINKAVATQSIPLARYQDQQSQNQNKLSALQTLDTPLQALQSAISTLASSVGENSLVAYGSDPSLVSVSLSNAAMDGVYQLEINDLGSTTQTVSANNLTTVSDPSSQSISSGSSFTLTVNGVQTTLSPSSNTLKALVQTINSNPSLGVTASLVNVGSSGSPDYRLAIQSSKLGPTTISLSDGSTDTNGDPVDLLQTISTGVLAQYKVNGLPQTITSDSDTINLAPGVSLSFLQTTAEGSPMTVTVTRSTTAAQTALQGFATAYNNVVDALAGQHGQGAGALSGDSILMSVKQTLSGINGYRDNSGSLAYLSAIGLDLDSTGHLTYNATEFQNSVGSNIEGLQQFLGDTTTGFIASATNAVDNLIDPVSGLINTEESSLNSNLVSLNKKISDTVNQINLFQQNLVNQLAKSDATISVLDGQTTFLHDLFNYNINGANN
jgi:flagellar hook-associated protein 2